MFAYHAEAQCVATLLPDMRADRLKGAGAQAKTTIRGPDEDQSEIPDIVLGMATEEIDDRGQDAIVIENHVDELVAKFLAFGHFVEQAQCISRAWRSALSAREEIRIGLEQRANLRLVVRFHRADGISPQFHAKPQMLRRPVTEVLRENQSEKPRKLLKRSIGSLGISSRFIAAPSSRLIPLTQVRLYVVGAAGG